MLVLYHAAHSTCSQKVRMVLHEKDVEFDAVQIDLGKKEQLKRTISRSIRMAWSRRWWMTVCRSSNRA